MFIATTEHLEIIMQPSDLTNLAFNYALLLFSFIVTTLALYTILMGKSKSAQGFFGYLTMAIVGLTAFAFAISATLITATITGVL